MTRDQQQVLDRRKGLLLKACSLVDASVSRTGDFSGSREYTPEQREPFDALSDRFVRAVETALHFFRAYERFLQGTSSGTTRDLLHLMERQGLIGDSERWMDMRDVRNRIVHDYAPGEVERLYADIRGPFHGELRRVAQAVAQLSFGGKEETR